MLELLKQQMEIAGIKFLDESNISEVTGGAGNTCEECCYTSCCKSCSEKNP